VTAPDGGRWRVRRRWLERPARRRSLRFAPNRLRGEDLLDVAWLPDPSSLLDAADNPRAGIALVAGGVLLVAIVVVALLPLLGVALELAVPLSLAGSGVVGRLLLRRPWTIEAVNLERPGERTAFTVVGWRRSRRAIAALAAAIAANGVPSALPETTSVPGGIESA